MSLRADPGGIFDSDEHRRVCGNLAQPRSLGSLQRELFADANVTLSETELVDILKDLQASGDVKNIGTVVDGDDLVKAIKGEDTPKLDKEHLETLRIRANAKPHLYVEGELWVMTSAGHDNLGAEQPNPPPPLQGAALKAALEGNVELAQQTVELEHNAEDRTPEQIAAAEQVLADQQAALDAYQETS